MGTYNKELGVRRSTIKTSVEAVREFGRSMFEATEIEVLDLSTIKNLERYPKTFFLVNVGIDAAMEELRAKDPTLFRPQTKAPEVQKKD